MKIAMVGKGGAGKTTLAGTLARILARKRYRVLAIDGDPNPNLALTLGMARADVDRIRSIPSSLVESVTTAPGQSTLRMTMDRSKVLGEYAAQVIKNAQHEILFISHLPETLTSARFHLCPNRNRTHPFGQDHFRSLSSNKGVFDNVTE